MSVNPTQRKADELERTIRDLDGLARELDLQIKIEEKRVRVSDPAQPKYPSFAVSARQRLDKLRVSIALFESELRAACSEVEQAREHRSPPVRRTPHERSPKT